MKRFLRNTAAVLTAMTLAVSLCGCNREEMRRQAEAKRVAEEQAETAARLAAEQAARPKFGDMTVCRFIEAKRDEMATIPGMGNFGLLIGIDWSTLPEGPTKSLVDIEAELEADFERQMKEYRESGKDELEKQFVAAVEAECPLYKKGDYIDLTLHNGVGSSAKVHDKLVSVGRDRILVGNRWIAKVDLSAEEQACFFPEEHAAFVGQRVSQMLQKAHAEAMQELAKAHEKALYDAWVAAGYVPDISLLAERGMKVDAKYWMTKVGLMKRIAAYLRSPAGTQYDDELEALEDGE